MGPGGVNGFRIHTVAVQTVAIRVGVGVGVRVMTKRFLQYERMNFTVRSNNSAALPRVRIFLLTVSDGGRETRAFGERDASTFLKILDLSPLFWFLLQNYFQ